jgi:hypothetical protein
VAFAFGSARRGLANLAALAAVLTCLEVTPQGIPSLNGGAGAASREPANRSRERGSSPDDVTCRARSAFNGQPVPAREQAGSTGGAYAVSNWIGGWPVITYGPRFSSLSPLEQRFTRIHECAHLSIPTTSEIVANCTALRTLRGRGLSEEQERQIARWHKAEGSVGPQYCNGDIGCTGAAFWELTLQCAGPR